MDSFRLAWVGGGSHLPPNRRPSPLHFEAPFSEEGAARQIVEHLALARAQSPPKSWTDARQGHMIRHSELRLKLLDGECWGNLYDGNLVAPARSFQSTFLDTRHWTNRQADTLQEMRLPDTLLCWDGAAAVLAGAARYMAARERFFASLRQTMEDASESVSIPDVWKSIS